MRAKTDQLDALIGQAGNQRLTTQAQITANEERVAQWRERAEDQQAGLVRCQRRLMAERLRLKELARQIEAEQAGLAETERRAADQRELIGQLIARDQQLARELSVSQADLEDEKAGIIDLLRRTSHLHNELAGLDVQRESLTGRKDRLNARDAEIARQLEQLLMQKAQLEARRDEIDELIRAETDRLDVKKRQAAELHDRRAGLAAELLEAKEQRSALHSRQQVLLDLEQRLEGVAAGVREILRRREGDPAAGDLSCVQGMVADLFETDVAHAPVVEAALGEFDQYLVVSDSRRFLADRKRMQDLPGRAHAICVDRLPPFVDGRDFSNQPGVVCNVASLVRFPKECEHLARHLLGKTLLVETLDDALGLSESTPPGYRFITREGQVLEPDGRVSVGPPGSRAGLISRKSQLRDVETQLQKLADRITVLGERVSRADAEAERLDRVQQELRTAIYEAHTSRVENNAALANNAEAVRRLTEEQPVIAGEVQMIERQIAEAMERARQSEESLAELRRLDAEHHQRVEDMQERIDLAVAERSRLAEQRTEAQIAAGQLAEKRTAAIETTRSLSQAKGEADAAAAEGEREMQEARLRTEQTERSILAAESRLAELYLAKERLAADEREQRRQRESARTEADRLAAVARGSQQALDEVEARLHELQLQLREHRVRRDELITRVRDELSIDLPEQYKQYQHTDQDWAAVEAEIAELRQKIDRLGNVNPDAITEQEELEQRHSFLTGQRDDLLDSRKRLENLIDRLNAESRERFATTFEQIRGHFQELFRKLFGGGKADIILDQPAEGPAPDVLEAGIEIVARPPGKELQSISLLSGGEKTLAAIALLLGIFRSRPSPFALLDEVDAALDEANNERFNRLLDEFLAQTQFIIITHSKRTIGVADALYGVTMQEAGVSQRVSVRFEEQPRRTPAVA